MRGKGFVERVTDVAMQSEEQIFKQPLLELCGEHRILIEHHRGIGEYTTSRIDVKVKFGTISICGDNLLIGKLTATQIVILGNIASITLFKGGGK